MIRAGIVGGTGYTGVELLRLLSQHPQVELVNEARRRLDAGARVIDISADFRIEDIAEWERWSKTRHVAPELVAEAVYGLCEVNREKIRGARLVANPGCYPTAVQLGLVPAVEAGVVDLDHLIADAKSGVSGAGRKLAPVVP